VPAFRFTLSHTLRGAIPQTAETQDTHVNRRQEHISVKQTDTSFDPHLSSTTIDLPGETVQFWRSTEKVKVVLRKHRDILLDIQLFKGMRYTVHAEQSAFYDAGGKKIVFKGRPLTFKDGERTHLWVSREFKGALIIKANEKVLGRYEPNKLDPADHGADPKTKPAPLIVIWHNEPSANPQRAQANGAHLSCVFPDKKSTSKSATQFWADAQVPEMKCAAVEPPQTTTDHTMHVIEVKQEDPNLPNEVAAFFKKGGEQTAIDTNGQITRNWLWGAIAGTAAYLDDNHHWIKELWSQKFYLQKIIHKNAGTRWYIVFKGNQKLRQYFTAPRYGVINSKVLAITGGVGSTAGLRHGAWDAAKGSLKKAGALAVVFTVALDIAEWISDYEERDPKTGKPKKDFFDLAFKIGIDLVKAGLSAALGAAAMGALVMLGIVTGGAAMVVGAIILSIVVGLAIDWIDKKTGATDSVNILLRKGIEYLEKKMPADYGNYDSAVQQAVAYGGMGA
jgi:hypothetical protein